MTREAKAGVMWLQAKELAATRSWMRHKDAPLVSPEGAIPTVTLVLAPEDTFCASGL